MKLRTIIIAAIVGLIAITLSIASCSVVPPGHRGVSVTLGKVDPAMKPEGLAFKAPFIEHIVNMPVQQISKAGSATCFSSDLQTVVISFTAMYRIPEGKVVELYQQYAGDPYTALVESRIWETLKQVTATYTAEELVKNREAIKMACIEKLRVQLAGLIDLRDLPLTNVDLTDQLEKAIEQKQVMQQQALAKNYELQRQQKEAEITMVNARAEADAVKIKGEALKASPEVISLEIAKRWDGKTPQSVVVGTGGANVLLPLR